MSLRVSELKGLLEPPRLFLAGKVLRLLISASGGAELLGTDTLRLIQLKLSRRGIPCSEGARAQIGVSESGVEWVCDGFGWACPCFEGPRLQSGFGNWLDETVGRSPLQNKVQPNPTHPGSRLPVQRERERDGERERERDRQRDRQTDRQTDRYPMLCPMSIRKVHVPLCYGCSSPCSEPKRGSQFIPAPRNSSFLGGVGQGSRCERV